MVQKRFMEVIMMISYFDVDGVFDWSLRVLLVSELRQKTRGNDSVPTI